MDGHIHQVFSCGHTQRAPLDADGMWVKEATNCAQCLQEIREGARESDGLTDDEILRAIDRGDWKLSDDQRASWLIRAKHVWHYLRYGDEGIPKHEQSTEGC